MNIDNPRIILELRIPGIQVSHHLETHNREIEEQVKEGVDAAIKQLAEDKYIANAVKEQIVKGVIEGITGNVFSKWEALDAIKKNVAAAIEKETEEYSRKIIEEVTQKLRQG